MTNFYFLKKYRNWRNVFIQVFAEREKSWSNATKYNIIFYSKWAKQIDLCVIYNWITFVEQWEVENIDTIQNDIELQTAFVKVALMAGQR